MIIIIDNYDSFTYNLKQYLLELNQSVKVYRNDEIAVEEIEKIAPSHIIISPGPGRPENAGISCEVISRYSGKIPILGVCLGHQSIGQVFGGKIVSAKTLMHGKTSKIEHDGKGLFTNIPVGFTATRYHSLVIDKDSLPEDIEVTASVPDGTIMGIRHKKFLTMGVQFHPESILTGSGKDILKNFLEFTYMKKAEGTIIKEAIGKLIEKEDLTQDMAHSIMNEIMEGNTTDAQIGAFLTSLRLKGESIDEITAFAVAMREKSIKIIPERKNLIDTCGTGGDASGTFNISTTAAFIAAGAGLGVAKHGNRSISSRSGSADLLEAMNININLSPESVAKSIDEVGIGFLFAPKLHPAMKYAIGPRREIGIRTVFNILGPLTNPANADFQVLGIYDQTLVEKIAEVLINLGVKKGAVVSSDDGLDEVSLSAPTLVAMINNGKISMKKFEPMDAGYKNSPLSEIKGGVALDNAEIVNRIFNGEKGAPRDVACLNAGFSISIVNNVSISEGVKIAEDTIDSGRAKKIVQSLVDFSNSI